MLKLTDCFGPSVLVVCRSLSLAVVCINLRAVVLDSWFCRLTWKIWVYVIYLTRVGPGLKYSKVRISSRISAWQRRWDETDSDTDPKSWHRPSDNLQLWQFVLGFETAFKFSVWIILASKENCQILIVKLSQAFNMSGHLLLVQTKHIRWLTNNKHNHTKHL